MVSRKITCLNGLFSSHVELGLTCGLQRNHSLPTRDLNEDEKEVQRNGVLAFPRKNSCLKRQSSLFTRSIYFRFPLIKNVAFEHSVTSQKIPSTQEAIIQTEPCDVKTPILPVKKEVKVSTNLSSFFHHLNTQVTPPSPDSTAPLKTSSLTVRVWKVLGRMNYSPALFNLGVWYHHRAQSHSVNRSSYLIQAEKCYLQAVEVDHHSKAAYNLASLLVRSGRKHVVTDTNSYTVAELLNIAISQDLEIAQLYAKT